MTRPEWRSTQLLAWTDRDGPSRPPSGGSPAMWTATAATLGVVFSLILFTDALCPEHRAWVQVLSGFALLGVVTSIVGLLRGWPSAALITAASAALGAGIGLIDAIHAPLRGGFIAAAFVVALAQSASLAVRQVPLLRWDRRLRRDVIPAPEVWLPEPAVETPTEGRETAAPEVHARR